MPDNKPHNLLELMAKERQMATADLAESAAADFSVGDNKKQLDKDKGLEFTNGNYNLRQHPEILAGAEEIGKEILQMADKQGVRIESLPEFKNADFNHDGKVDAKEIGATLLAASLVTGAPHFDGGQMQMVVATSGTPVSDNAAQADVVSVFKNELTGEDIQSITRNLLYSKTTLVIPEIARQILGDNKDLLGMKDIPNTDSAAADRQFVTNVKPNLTVYR